MNRFGTLASIGLLLVGSATAAHGQQDTTYNRAATDSTAVIDRTPIAGFNILIHAFVPHASNPLKPVLLCVDEDQDGFTDRIAYEKDGTWHHLEDVTDASTGTAGYLRRCETYALEMLALKRRKN